MIDFAWLTKKHLGLFDSPTKAALAYNKEALILHGEYAVFNEI